MSDAHGLTKENLLFTFPVSLRGNPSIAALGDVTAEALAKRPEEIGRISIYPKIDELPEALLDILAYDFKVDWWDPNYSLEEKRQVFKDSWYVHRHMGTKAAVERAISAIYPNTRVLEWWEYGGEPYHFKLDINVTSDHIDSDKQRRVLERLNFYKNLRSHNDGVTYFVEAAPAIAKAASSVTGFKESTHISLVVPVPIIKPTASARVGAITGLWESAEARINLDAPTLRRVSAARVRATAGVQEVFTTCAILPDTDPPSGAAHFKTGVSGAWQEHYTTEAIQLAAPAPTAAIQARARGAVAARQETAQTTINFSRR